MSKMKQATLFSLKSWKKIAVEDIVKYKDILDNQDDTEVILRTLTSLKKKNPSKDLVLSTGIDSSLKKLMETHSSPIVTNEVKKLIFHWKLDISCKYPNVIEENKKCLMSETNLEKKSNNNMKETFGVSKKSEPLPLTNVKFVTNVSKPQPLDEPSVLKTSAKSEKKDENVCKTPPVLEVCETNTGSQVCKTSIASQICKMQTAKQVCKKSSINNLRKSEVNRRLHFAMQLFMEEVGKQEVKMYLEASA